MRGGGHISAASRGLVPCSPGKFLYSTLDNNSGGGGGELKLEGGNPSAPPFCMQPWAQKHRAYCVNKQCIRTHKQAEYYAQELVIHKSMVI